MNDKILKDLTILYVEDDETIKSNTIITLKLVSAIVIDASNGKEGLEKFKENVNNIDIILTDLSMPIMNGLEMVEEIQKIRNDIPIIITTAHQEISYLKKAIELGVTSYILKPIQIYNIIESIIKSMEPVRLKKELIQKNQELIKLNNTLEEKISLRTKELELLASTDPLTGINNRRNFFKLANEKFKTSGEDLYSVMIDIDNFKDLNDTYGHKLGDEILILLTKTISDKLHEDDAFGRLGGEEFAIIYNSTDSTHIDKIEELRASVENLRYQDIEFTISLGIAQKTQNDTIDTLLSRADNALYEAKGSGRNKLIFRGN